MRSACGSSAKNVRLKKLWVERMLDVAVSKDITSRKW
jgi:hypothetical protein